MRLGRKLKRRRRWRKGTALTRNTARADRQTREALTQKELAESRLLLVRKAEYARRIDLSTRLIQQGNEMDAENELSRCAWDLRGWEHRHLSAMIDRCRLSLYGHQSGSCCVAWNPDGTLLVSGPTYRRNDNYIAQDAYAINVWDVRTRQVMRVLNGHEGWVDCIAFSPDGKRIVSGSHDKTLRVWNATTGKEMAILKGHASPVTVLAFTPDGTRIVSGANEIATHTPLTGPQWTTNQ